MLRMDLVLLVELYKTVYEPKLMDLYTNFPAVMIAEKCSSGAILYDKRRGGANYADGKEKIQIIEVVIIASLVVQTIYIFIEIATLSFYYVRILEDIFSL
ncbi:hypothetical protein ABFS83_10G121800 [Erythranthe nasuta]